MTARTDEAFDSTTFEQRPAAIQTAAHASATGLLGSTIASLGNPADFSIWPLMPLLDKVQAGRVQYGDTSVAPELRPITGQPTGASQLPRSTFRAFASTPA